MVGGFRVVLLPWGEFFFPVFFVVGAPYESLFLPPGGLY